ncbi:MAG TPA: alpha/beta hydrolase [Bryobacteraceae bacterium]|nr:alpha/beta hydrolase [Bryobacteraceae bacterium]
MTTWAVWAGAAILLYGVAAWGASRMLYYPMKYPAGNWEVQESIGARDVHLRAADGTALHAWWIERPGAKLATIHLHGNAGNVTHRALSAEHILAAGSSVLLLDYRGYGKSEGRPSEKGLYQDAEAAFKWVLSQGFRPQQIILHGESLGTAVATHLAAGAEVGGVILEAPLTSARAVAGRVVPVLGPLLVSGYNSLGRIKKVRAPLLVIHGDRDEVLAYDLGQELFRAANEPKTFWTIRNATHNDIHLVGRAEFSIRLAAFYRTLREQSSALLKINPAEASRLEAQLPEK